MSSASAPAPQAGPQPAEQLLQHATGYMVSAALYGVTALGIPDLLQAGSKSVTELAVSTGTNEETLYRVLRALASVGLFAEGPGRTFSLNAVSEPLCAGGPGSLRDLALWLCDPFHLEVYGQIPNVLRSGRPVTEERYGVSCFDYFDDHKEIGERFHNAMTGFSASVIAAVLDSYDFAWLDGKTLVDVAGGHGKVLTEILKRCPGARGVLFDLESVVGGAQGRIASEGLAERCATAHGDFFQAVPEGDAYLMKHILRDWDDARALEILGNIHRAARPGARLLVLEAVMSGGQGPDFAKWMDLEMLLLPGGRERTGQDYRALLEAGGFRLTRVVPDRSALSLLEAERLER